MRIPANPLLRRLQELRLPPDERRAARAERRVEDQLRRERDNTETAARRAARLQAERRRWPGGDWSL